MKCKYQNSKVLILGTVLYESERGLYLWLSATLWRVGWVGKNKIRKRIHLSPTILESRGSPWGSTNDSWGDLVYGLYHNGYAHWTNKLMNPKAEIMDPGNMEVSPYKKDFPPFLIMRSFQRASRQRLGKQTSTAVPAVLLLRSCSASSSLFHHSRVSKK